MSDPSPPGQHQPLDEEALVAELREGKRRFHALPSSLEADRAADLRRRALEQITGADLGHLGHFSLDARRASTRHCENFLGAVQIPVGILGPLPVRGQFVDGDVYVPLATTEGALVASVNRGCAAIREAGGARLWVEDAGMTRAPVFRTSGIDETRRLLGWLEENHDEIRRVAEATSNHLELREVRPFVFGTSVFLRFCFGTGDAMGMNMVTIACDRVVHDLIEPATGIRCSALSGNYCSDKKPAQINIQEGRGKSIHAEVRLPEEVLARKLKTDAKRLAETQYRKNLLGSIAAGSKGFNAQVANVAAAFFIATGQDPAHVAEAAVALTCIEAQDDGSALASLFLPDVPLGAVGGGTALATQAAALELLGVRPDPEHPGAAVGRLAEIFGATALAGELSLMAALTSRDLAGAHERLGRGR
jgi:hydroxymethylglutaryl-CoA reductase (NADPH)